MAFQFIPNESGGFDEGDKQTNPDTGVEYIYVNGAWRALGAKIEDEFDTLDERYVKLEDGYATEDYVDDAITDANLDQYFKKSGGTITGTLTFQRGNEKDSNQFKVSPNGGTDYATSIYSLNGGQMRFRTSHTSSEGDHVGSHIILDANDGAPQTKIYKLVEPTQPDHAANKQYVDDNAGGVPVGSIMIWMNSTPPDGWFKLQGNTFDVSKYPLLHAYLQETSGYSSGRLPNWSGYYPGNYGDHLTHDLGSKQGYKTGMPSGGAPYHPNSIPNGNTRTFNATGGTNAYSDGKARPAITEGWDSTTRPKTVVVHYIIKHD